MKKLSSLLLILLVILLPIPCHGESEIIPYSEMEYSRPDLAWMQSVLEEACSLAEGNDAQAILDGVYAFYDEYDWFYTCYSLADIRYSADLTDKYWAAENEFCLSSAPQVDQMLDDLYYALAESPARDTLEAEFFGEGFFTDYDGDYLWADEVLDLMADESALISRYYSQSNYSANPLTNLLFHRDDQLAQTLVDLITVRNEIATCYGYDSYASFANDYYYYRDFSPDQLDDYLEQIRVELVPLYREYWSLSADLEETDEVETLAFVRNAAQKMGGTIRDAFRLMEDAGLYDIGYGENKYNSSFEVYLSYYYEPFLFLNPSLTVYDHLSLAHEFGHFANDYASCGSSVGTDVSEIFSQGMEYMVLCYGEDTEALTVAKMADSLCTFVEQACFARFEQEMYRLETPSIITLCALYQSIAQEYGFDAVGFDPMEFVTITHFYTNPMYLSSYVISNDAALQLYQMELENPGSGLACLNENLDVQEPYFLAFLEQAGLESPFAPGRLREVKATFESVFAEAGVETSPAPSLIGEENASF